MDFQRIILIAGIALVSFALLTQWSKQQEAKQELVQSQQQQQQLSAVSGEAPTAPVASTSEGDVPLPGSTAQAPADLPMADVALENSGLIDVSTDLLKLKIDPTGGDIVMSGLLKHPVSLKAKDQPLIMLTRTPNSLYIAQSGLVGQNGTDKGSERPHFTSARQNYHLADGEQQLQVDLHFTQADGVQLTKRYTFTRGDYLIQVSYLVNNTSANDWRAHFYGQIQRDTHLPPESGMIGMKPFLGAATTTSESNYYKMTFDEMSKQPLQTQIQGGWMAMVQHHFISAWIGNKNEQNHYFAKAHPSKANTYLMGYTAPQVVVAAGKQAQINAEFYVGPKDVYRLQEISPYLDLTVDYGMLWWIAKPLFMLMHWIHSLVGNWGLAIIGLTIVVKGVFLWPSTLSYKSMAAMKRIAPKMQEMKDAYGDNPNKMREEMFKMYQKEGVNPMLGCLPMLIQAPVFIALYWSLMESYELRLAPFFGWIHDLSMKDPWFLLPLLMGFTMWIQQKLNPPATDPMQQKIFQWMPIIFTAMFLFFPAGLVLYMLVNNIISMTHQYIVYKRVDQQYAAKAHT